MHFLRKSAIMKAKGVSAMNNNDDFNFFMSDIDKIQEEIERDLNAGSDIQGAPSPESDTFAKFLLVPEEYRDDTTPEVSNAGISTSSGTVDEAGEVIRTETSRRKRKSWFGVAACLLFVCTLGTGMLGFGIGSGWAFFRGGNSGSTVEFLSPDFTRHTFETVQEVATLADMIELIAPSVVGITTHYESSGFTFERGAGFSHGSGIIFAYSHDRIFIATNLYVVRPGYRWDVSIAGSEPIAARPAGVNRYYDLAVAYIYNADLIAAGIDTVTFATFGDSDEMRIGDVVLAIGNAMGEGTAVTRGIISADERPFYLPGREYPLALLQTDAAINYGNSGGPLINTRGEIIGINMNRATRFITDPVLSEGMGYSISSNIAAPILQQIVENYRRPAIGIGGTSLADDPENRAERWGIPALGVIILEVQEGRAAYNAGLREGDVITGFDGQPVFYMQQLQDAVRAKQIGDIAEIRILRGGRDSIVVQVEIAEMVREFFNE